MKRIILLIAFCLSLSAIYAQTIDVIHMKNGFDARGTITNRTESQIPLQTENGQTLTINTYDIASMGQEQKVFDPRVLIGRWACYKANGERDRTYDMVISENEGFYTVSYDYYLNYYSDDNSLCCHFNCNPKEVAHQSKDIDVTEGNISYRFNQTENCWLYANSRKEHVGVLFKYTCDIDLKYVDGKLRGSVDCLNYYEATGNERYRFVEYALEAGRGTVGADGPGGKWNVYFVKY